MRRLLAMAVLLAGAGLPFSLRAQQRVSFRSVAPTPIRVAPGLRAVRPIASPGRIFAPRMGPVLGRPRLSGFGGGRRVKQIDAGYWPGTPCLTNPGYANSFFCRQYLPPQEGITLVPAFVPMFWYAPPVYAPEEEAPAPAPVPVQEDALARQVERLTDEVALLREERPVAQTPLALSAVPHEKPVPLVLVYLDGHQDEVENYAVLGRTLYVFGVQTARRIPLADLNLEATRKLNEERGIEFAPATMR